MRDKNRVEWHFGFARICEFCGRVRYESSGASYFDRMDIVVDSYSAIPQVIQIPADATSDIQCASYA